MAIKNSDNMAKVAAIPSQLVDTPDMGKVRVLVDSYTLPGVKLEATDVIQFMSIPAGAKVLNCKLAWTAMTAGAGVLGFASDTDALAPSQTLNSAGQYLSDSAIATNVGLLAAPLAAETPILLTMSVATTATTGTIKLVVEYAFV